MLDWMKHKLESRLPGEISITSDMQMTPPFFFPPFSEFLVIVFTVLRGQACYRGLTAKPKLAWPLTLKMRTQCVNEETSALEAGGTVVLG